MAPTRRPTARPAPRPAFASALLAALLLAGCSKKSEPTGPTGDNTGEHLVVYATDQGRASGNYAIALYDLDAGAFRSLANLNDAGSQSDPCISNDGNFVVFAATRGSGATHSDLYLYDRLQQALLPTPGLNTVSDESWPRFTYDSVKLAFARRIATGEKRVRLYEPLGDTLIDLPGLDAPGGFDDDMPAPNLDGSRIAFVSNRAATLDVLVWNRGTGIGTFPALASPGTDTEPSLSANGRWLAFASDRTGGMGGFDVYLYDLTGDSLVTLPGLNSNGDDRHPSVSADGDVIVFQSDRAGGGGHYDLYHYIRSTAALDQPAAFKSASDDIQPYLRSR
jgi:Tol biopolymer transport system component